jgi:hypothetical protein
MRTSTRMEIDGFSKKLDQAILLFDKFDKAGYRDDQPRIPKGQPGGGRWGSGGGGGVSDGSKQPRTGTDATIRRRARRLEAERQSAVKALDEIRKHAQDPNASPTKIQSAVDKLKTSQERLREALNGKLGENLKDITKGFMWLDLAMSAGITLVAVNIAGAIHPAFGALAAVYGVGYLAYRTYQTIKG